FSSVAIVVSVLVFLCIPLLAGFFSFSSRRRHTRSNRDWSSDVCSSDLETECTKDGRGSPRPVGPPGRPVREPGHHARNRIHVPRTRLSSDWCGIGFENPFSGVDAGGRQTQIQNGTPRGRGI